MASGTGQTRWPCSEARRQASQVQTECHVVDQRALYKLLDKNTVDDQPYRATATTAFTYANRFVNSPEGRRLWLSLNVDDEATARSGSAPDASQGRRECFLHSELMAFLTYIKQIFRASVETDGHQSIVKEM